jgi:antitoxin component YwqK of YwqJK toxin-antitoxin module
VKNALSSEPRPPRSIPRGARALPVDGSPRGADYFVGDRRIARIYYHPTGAVEWETHYDEQGRLHGLERQQFEDGRTMYRARWAHGLQVGLQQQWDEEGRLLVATRFVRGTGLDLWFDCGRLCESREYVHGRRQGAERWCEREHAR